MPFFGDNARFDYFQIPGMDEISQQQKNFDPWGSKPALGMAGNIFKQSLGQFFGNRKTGAGPSDPSQNILTTAPLGALKAGYATAGRNLRSRAVATGDAALANSGLNDARAAEIKSRMDQDYSGDATRVIEGAQNQALGGYQNAINDQRQFGLGAAGLRLRGLEGAADTLRMKYLGPTGYKPGTFDLIQKYGQQAAAAAAMV